VISSLVHHVRPDDSLIENKGPKHDVYLFDSLHLNKVLLCFDLPTLYHCDTVIAHNRDEPRKERDSAFDSF